MHGPDTMKLLLGVHWGLGEVRELMLVGFQMVLQWPENISFLPLY